MCPPSSAEAVNAADILSPEQRRITRGLRNVWKGSSSVFWVDYSAVAFSVNTVISISSKMPFSLL